MYAGFCSPLSTDSVYSTSQVCGEGMLLITTTAASEQGERQNGGAGKFSKHQSIHGDVPFFLQMACPLPRFC